MWLLCIASCKVHNDIFIQKKLLKTKMKYGVHNKWFYALNYYFDIIEI